MSDHAREARDLSDAAAVHAARQDIATAIASLAARPLEELAAEQMRRALTRSTSASVRRSLRRLAEVERSSRPVLVAVHPIVGRAVGSPLQAPQPELPGPCRHESAPGGAA